MSYHIYTTRGIILSERPRREADRLYVILTRDLGLVWAVGLGVRKEESKLRGALEPIQLSTISLVRGKEFWRITSAESIEKIPATPSVARPLSLLESLVQGEDPNPELFDAVESALCQTSDVRQGEVGFVSHILYHLGYLKEEDLDLDEKSLTRAINEALQHTHLT